MSRLFGNPLSPNIGEQVNLSGNIPVVTGSRVHVIYDINTDRSHHRKDKLKWNTQFVDWQNGVPFKGHVIKPCKSGDYGRIAAVQNITKGIIVFGGVSKVEAKLLHSYWWQWNDTLPPVDRFSDDPNVDENNSFDFRLAYAGICALTQALANSTQTDDVPICKNYRKSDKRDDERRAYTVVFALEFLAELPNSQGVIAAFNRHQKSSDKGLSYRFARDLAANRYRLADWVHEQLTTHFAETVGKWKKTTRWKNIEARIDAARRKLAAIPNVFNSSTYATRQPNLARKLKKQLQSATQKSKRGVSADTPIPTSFPAIALGIPLEHLKTPYAAPAAFFGRVLPEYVLRGLKLLLALLAHEYGRPVNAKPYRAPTSRFSFAPKLSDLHDDDIGQGVNHIRLLKQSLDFLDRLFSFFVPLRRHGHYLPGSSAEYAIVDTKSLRRSPRDDDETRNRKCHIKRLLNTEYADVSCGFSMRDVLNIIDTNPDVIKLTRRYQHLLTHGIDAKAFRQYCDEWNVIVDELRVRTRQLQAVVESSENPIQAAYDAAASQMLLTTAEYDSAVRERTYVRALEFDPANIKKSFPAITWIAHVVPDEVEEVKFGRDHNEWIRNGKLGPRPTQPVISRKRRHNGQLLHFNGLVGVDLDHSTDMDADFDKLKSLCTFACESVSGRGLWGLVQFDLESVSESNSDACPSLELFPALSTPHTTPSTSPFELIPFFGQSDVDTDSASHMRPASLSPLIRRSEAENTPKQTQLHTHKRFEFHIKIAQALILKRVMDAGLTGECDLSCQDPGRIRYLGAGKWHLDTSITHVATAEERKIVDRIWADQAKSSYDVDPRLYFGLIPVLVPGTPEPLCKTTSEAIAA